jgi:hypothetical protein
VKTPKQFMLSVLARRVEMKRFVEGARIYVVGKPLDVRP